MRARKVISKLQEKKSLLFRLSVVGVENFWADSSSGAKCCKTFYICNLRMILIS
jgi:hypothetical protein